MSDILTQLAAVLEARKSADPKSSYVAGLYPKGLDAILKKIGEEATETVIAAKGGDNAQIVYETADLSRAWPAGSPPVAPERTHVEHEPQS